MAGSHIAFRTVLNRSVIALLAAGMPQRTLALDPFAGLAAVSDEQLDRFRGGFQNSQGMQFSFAIERAIVVNGELVSTTRIVLNDLSPLLAGGVPSAEVVASARSIIQSGLGNTITPLSTPAAATPAAGNAAAAASSVSSVATTPATSSTGSSTSNAVQTPTALTATTPPASGPVGANTPTNIASPTAASSVATSTVATSPPAAGPSSSAPSTAAVPGPAAPAAEQQSVAAASAATGAASATTQAASSTPGTLYIRMNAAGQTILIPNASAIVTAVQNTVNNQVIQARTTIDATLNSLSALRASSFAESLRQQALDGLRRP